MQLWHSGTVPQLPQNYFIVVFFVCLFAFLTE